MENTLAIFFQEDVETHAIEPTRISFGASMQTKMAPCRRRNLRSPPRSTSWMWTMMKPLGELLGPFDDFQGSDRDGDGLLRPAEATEFPSFT